MPKVEGVSDMERLRMALEPFAEEAAKYDPPENDSGNVAWNSPFHIGDLREARAAITSIEEHLHTDDLAVDRFAIAMKQKLKYAREVKGRGGWEDKVEYDQQYVSDLLHSHVEKGDPVDIANFCMMLHQRGEKLLPAGQPSFPTGERTDD